MPSQAKALKRRTLRGALIACVLLAGSTTLTAQTATAPGWQPNRLPPAPSMQPLSAAAATNHQASSAPVSNASAPQSDTGVVLRWRTSSRLNSIDANGSAGSQSANQSTGNRPVSASAAVVALEQTHPNQNSFQSAAPTQFAASSSTGTSGSAANPLRGGTVAVSQWQASASSGMRETRRTNQHSAPRDSAVRTAAYQPPAAPLPAQGAVENLANPGLPQPPMGIPGAPLQPVLPDALGAPEAAPAPPGFQGLNPAEPIPASPLLNPAPQNAAQGLDPVAPKANWPENAPSLVPSQPGNAGNAADSIQPNAQQPDNENRPDPFQRGRALEESPSDRDQFDKREDDLNRQRPANDASLNCESFRDRLRKSTLDKVNLNSSPRYGQGLNADLEEAEKQRLSFAATAETRTWCDRAGRTLVDGRMVDLRNEQVVLDINGQRREIPLRDLCDVDLAYVGKAWNLPVSCGSGYEPVPGRDFVPSAVQWKASGLCHKPLYFEEVQLERYGHEIGPVLQPLVSTAHFFGNIAVLPYKMGIHPPHECQYALGYYRPGDCAPYMVPPIPFSLRGAIVEAGVVSGAAALIP